MMTKDDIEDFFLTEYLILVQIFDFLKQSTKILMIKNDNKTIIINISKYYICLKLINEESGKTTFEKTYHKNHIKHDHLHNLMGLAYNE